MSKEKIRISIEDRDLDGAGFTNSGKSRYKDGIKDYSTVIFEKAIKFANVNKRRGMEREVTHDYVREAIKNYHPKEPKPFWFYITVPLEYIAMALTGLGAGNISVHWGQLLFGISLVVGFLLIFIRIIKEI